MLSSAKHVPASFPINRPAEQTCLDTVLKGRKKVREEGRPPAGFGRWEHEHPGPCLCEGCVQPSLPHRLRPAVSQSSVWCVCGHSSLPAPRPPAAPQSPAPGPWGAYQREGRVEDGDHHVGNGQVDDEEAGG